VTIPKLITVFGERLYVVEVTTVGDERVVLYKTVGKPEERAKVARLEDWKEWYRNAETRNES